MYVFCFIFVCLYMCVCVCLWVCGQRMSFMNISSFHFLMVISELSRYFLISCSYSYFFQNFGDRSQHSNYYWYKHHPFVPQLFFLFFVKVKVFFDFVVFNSVIRRIYTIHLTSSFFLLINSSCGIRVGIRWCINISASHRIISVL